MVGDPSSDWPGWAEPLRPDDLARARMRRGIHERSAPLLRRRRARLWPVLERWAGVLAPLAAAVLLLFAWAAVRGTESPGPAGSDALTRTVAASGGQTPAVLVSEIGPREEEVVETSFFSGL